MSEPDDTRPDDGMLSAYLDGELDPEDRVHMESVLGSDGEQRAELDAVAEVRALVRALDPPIAPEGWIESLLEGAAAPDNVVVDLRDHPRRRAARVTAAVAALAAAAAVLLAVVVPQAGGTHPALATDVRVHQAGAAASGDPVSGLAPLATPLGFGR